MSSRRRRGMSVTQWCVVAGLIALVVVGGIGLLGQNTNIRMGGIAGGMANPQDLTKMNK